MNAKLLHTKRLHTKLLHTKLLHTKPRRFWRVAWPVVLLILAGCPAPDGPIPAGGNDAGDTGGWTAPARELCLRTYSAFPAAVGNLADPALVETSGLVASFLNPDLLWMHNDSGDSLRVFATGTDGAARGQLAIGDEAIDVEDIAAGACPDGSGPCLFVADTGDNGRVREEVAIYIFPEPIVPAAGLGMSNAATWIRVPFTYDEGPVDVEAVVAAPDGGRLWLFEKIDQVQTRVFLLEGPLAHGVPLVAETITTLNSPGVGTVSNGLMMTAADLHPSGQQLVLRVYTGVYEYRFAPGEGVASIGEVEPLLVTLGPLTEPQGEALGYDATGFGLFSVSEDRDALPGQPLHHYECE